MSLTVVLIDIVDKVTTHTPANNIYLKLKSLIDSMSNAIIIEESKSKEIARKLQKATLDYTVLGVPGTDEDAIRDAINESGSQINFAKVCVTFHELTTKSFKDVYKDELGGGFDVGSTGYMKDQRTYVIEPIQDLPFITIDVNGEAKGLSEKEFFEQLELAKAGKTSDDSEECTPPAGFEAPFFTNSVKVMNDYAEKKSIQGYEAAPVQETWGDGHQEAWELFVKHAFENCDLFKSYNLPNEGKTWKEVSEALIGDFPGYTYNKQGFLAFCLDAYCCEKKYGAEARSSGGSGGGGGGGGATAPGAGGDQTRSGGSNKFTIVLDQTNRDFKGSGFSSSRGDIDELIIGVLKTQIKQSGLNTGVPAFSINGSIKLNNKGNAVEQVTTRIGDGSGSFLKNRRRVLDTGFKNAMTNMKFPDSGAYAPGSEGDETRVRRRGMRRAQRRGSKFINFTIKVAAGRIR